MNKTNFIEDNPWVKVLSQRGKDEQSSRNLTPVNKNGSSSNSSTISKIKNKNKLNNDNNEIISNISLESTTTTTTTTTKINNTCKNFYSLAFHFCKENYEFTREHFIMYLMSAGASYFTARNYLTLLKKFKIIKKINRKIFRSQIFEVKEG